MTFKFVDKLVFVADYIKVNLYMYIFFIRFKVVLTLESVDEILKCDHSNESY